MILGKFGSCLAFKARDPVATSVAITAIVALTMGDSLMVTPMEGFVTVTKDVTVSSDERMLSLGLVVCVAIAVTAELTVVVSSEVV